MSLRRQIAARFLLREVASQGCKIAIENGQPRLQMPGLLAATKQGEAILKKLKALRPEVLEYLERLKGGLCPICKLDLVDEEDRERLAWPNFLCSRGPSIRPKPWLNERGYQGCPYRGGTDGADEV